jgi:alkylation response protein AidB-like acyl-CoA dehydrogenase
MQAEGDIMRLEFTESQLALQQDLRVFFESETPIEAVREAEKDRALRRGPAWDQFVERGWLALPLPEAHGGQGRSFTDLCVLLEEVGRSLFTGPVLSTLVYGALPIASFGSESQKEQLLPMVARAGTVLTAALDDPESGLESRTVASQTGDGYVLRGDKVFVSAGDIADYVLVTARLGQKTGQSSIFIVPTNATGVTVRPTEALAPEFDCIVELDGVKLSADSMLGGDEAGQKIEELIFQSGAVGLCAQMLGATQKIFEMTVEYAKQREQFGRPIGSFQAVQHHCANMAIDVDSMRYVTYVAAGQMGTGENTDHSVALAKGWCSMASERVLALAHQVHAGVGFLEDHELNLFTRRLKVWGMANGSAQHHMEALADELGHKSVV